MADIEIVGPRDEVQLMDNQCTEEQAAQEAAVDKRFVIQAIKIHDDLGKCIWIHSQTIRVAFEKYLTELSSLVCDDVTYSEVALCISTQCDPAERDTPDLLKLFDGKVENASEVANRIGQFKRPDPPDILLDQAIFDAHFVVKMAERCRSLQSDLRKKLYNIAPNLTELVGELIAARFIKKAGSMKKLIKFPGSKLQLLGAEKALKRAMEEGGKTPKHGIIFLSTQVQQVEPKHRGRMARTLACKCIMAARVDYFSKDTSAEFGRGLRDQIEKQRMSWSLEGKSQKRSKKENPGVTVSLGVEPIGADPTSNNNNNNYEAPILHEKRTRVAETEFEGVTMPKRQLTV